MIFGLRVKRPKIGAAVSVILVIIQCAWETNGKQFRHQERKEKVPSTITSETTAETAN